MTPRQLKQVAARQAVTARIVSDGCRDYVVQLLSSNGAGLLRKTRGSTFRFRSLGEAHRTLSRCGVETIVLRQRVADDETASPRAPAAFHDMPITHH